jgi:hypothetical protein
MRGAFSSRATATCRTVGTVRGCGAVARQPVRDRLRARGLDAPARGAGECGPARMSCAEPVGTAVCSGPSQRRADADERCRSGPVRWLLSNVVGRTDGFVGTLRVPVVAVRAVGRPVARNGRRRRGDGRCRLVRITGRSVYDGAQADQHQQGGPQQTGKWVRSAAVGHGPWGVCGHAGNGWHRSSVRPGLLRPGGSQGRSKRAGMGGGGRSASTSSAGSSSRCAEYWWSSRASRRPVSSPVRGAWPGQPEGENCRF